MADLLETIEVPREIVKKDSPVIFRFFDDGIKALFEDDECKYTFAKFNAIRLKKAILRALFPTKRLQTTFSTFSKKS